jgi:hypothetical protein
MSVPFATHLRRSLLVAATLIPMGAGAATIEPGVRLPALALTDQHDKPVTIGPATRRLIFTSEKPASEAREPAQVANLPRRAGAATVLTLQGGKVLQVQYAADEAQLRQALGIAP